MLPAVLANDEVDNAVTEVRVPDLTELRRVHAAPDDPPLALQPRLKLVALTVGPLENVSVAVSC